jgi:hypothetical protein
VVANSGDSLAPLAQDIDQVATRFGL